jgi:hypothetical protein
VKRVGLLLLCLLAVASVGCIDGGPAVSNIYTDSVGYTMLGNNTAAGDISCYFGSGADVNHGTHQVGAYQYFRCYVDPEVLVFTGATKKMFFRQRRNGVTVDSFEFSESAPPWDTWPTSGAYLPPHPCKNSRCDGQWEVNVFYSATLITGHWTNWSSPPCNRSADQRTISCIQTFTDTVVPQ